MFSYIYSAFSYIGSAIDSTLSKLVSRRNQNEKKRYIKEAQKYASSIQHADMQKAANSIKVYGLLILSQLEKNPFSSESIVKTVKDFEGLAPEALNILKKRHQNSKEHADHIKKHSSKYGIQASEIDIQTKIEQTALGAVAEIGIQHASVAVKAVKILLGSETKKETETAIYYIMDDDQAMTYVQHIAHNHPSKATEIIDVLKKSKSEEAVPAIMAIAFHDLQATGGEPGAIFKHAVAALQKTDLDTHIDSIKRWPSAESSLILYAHLYKGLDGPIQDTIRKAAQTLTDRLLDPAALLETLSNKAPPPTLLQAFEAVDDSGMFQNNGNDDVSLVNLYQEAVQAAQTVHTVRSNTKTSPFELKQTAHDLNP